MKYTWTPDDIIAGRFVCANWTPKRSLDQYPADNPTWVYKLGFLAGEDSPKRYVMVSMCDGMIPLAYTKEELAGHLTETDMIPMRRDWFIRTMEKMEHLFS